MVRYPTRRRLRYPGYDYTNPAAYFVTAVIAGREPILGVPTRSGIVLSNAGQIVAETWRAITDKPNGVSLDTLVIMPDHVHAIIWTWQVDVSISARPLTGIVGWAKAQSARRINVACETPAQRRWQRSFHERIIRSTSELDKIRLYIERNPEVAWQARQR